MPEPLVTALRPGPVASGAEVARALGRGLLPAEDGTSPPAWLLPEQVFSFRRIIAAIRRYRGALLADPVGSGKTYVALAAAAALNPRSTTACLVPAPLVDQWRAVADQLGVAVSVVSHQRVSRGALPDLSPGLVVIDESHHFRHQRTRRYANAAPWLLGRAVLLVTATPIVNRQRDLLHQLLLGVRDDALRAAGVSSLRAMLAERCAAPALGELVIEAVRQPAGRPVRSAGVDRAEPVECHAAALALDLIARLRLSRKPPVAALFRTVLQRAASSSPAALLGALRRYRTLLLHSRDAVRAGHSLERWEIRRFTGELEQQMVWWELLPQSGEEMEIDLADLDTIDRVVEIATDWAAKPDAKVGRLRRLLSDGKPTLIFTSRRETVRHLRERLRELPMAWCTGNRAGVGRTALPRSVVLRWFREGTDRRPRPEVHHLLATDVAAEGLDLQRVARVVHYDLPWTPMRLEQREGRAVRLGSAHSMVEVVRFLPPSELERALKIQAALARKARLPGLAGLGHEGRRLWLWRTEMGERLSGGVAVPGVAQVPAAPAGALAGFSLTGSGIHAHEKLAFSLLWMDPSGAWTEAEDPVAERLLTAMRFEERSSVDPERLSHALSQLAEPMRQRLALLRGRRWSMASSSATAQRVATRLQESIRRAARERDLEWLARLERALAFVGGGHTAGEVMLLERLDARGEPGLLCSARRLPAPSSYLEVTGIRLEGIVLFTG